MAIVNVDGNAGRSQSQPCLPLFSQRWSPRAMNGAKVDDAALKRCLEAARWAASSYNGQPWRFVYAHRDTPQWAGVFGLLVEANQVWCKHAGVVAAIFARKNFELNEQPDITRQVSVGMALGNFMLQAS